MKTRKFPRRMTGRILPRRRTLKTVEVTLPAYWASYLINGDASTFDYYNEAVEDVQALLADAGVANLHCADVSDCTDYEIFNGLLTEVATYTFFA